VSLGALSSDNPVTVPPLPVPFPQLNKHLLVRFVKVFLKKIIRNRNLSVRKGSPDPIPDQLSMRRRRTIAARESSRTLMENRKTNRQLHISSLRSRYGGPHHHLGGRASSSNSFSRRLTCHSQQYICCAI